MMVIDVEPFKPLVRARCGLTFEGVGERRLEAALAERMRALGEPNAGRYLALLQADEGEFRALVNLLTINETYFFRDPEQIHWLVDRIVPRLLSRRGPAGRVRVLSAGCSSGEEPYSLAIALHQRYGAAAPQLFEIVAGDIDSNVIARAQAATFTAFSFRAMSPALRDAHFDGVNGRYRLKEPIRRMVGFVELNLVDLSALQDGCRYDLVLMRNVSIYFDGATRRRIQENLVTLMDDGAVLVTGSAETLANDLGVLRLVEDEGHFHFVHGSGHELRPRSMRQTAGRLVAAAGAMRPGEASGRYPAVPPVAAVPKAGAFFTPLTAEAPVTEALTDLASIRQLVSEERYASALPLLERLLQDTPGDVAARLLYAYANLNRREFLLAETFARGVIETDPWSVDAHFLLGMSAKWQHDLQQATDWFRKAVYLCSTCWPAHYFLGGLYTAIGEERAAMRAWRGCLQLLADASVDSGIRHLPLGLREQEIRFLCERRVSGAPLAVAADSEGVPRWR